MKRTDPFTRYSVHAYRWAFQRALARGFTPAEAWNSPQGRDYMTGLCEEYDRAQRPLPGLEPSVVRPNVPTPVTVPSDYHEASSDFFRTLEDVGTLRSLHLVSDGRGGYTATIKVTLPDGRQVYRYGRLQSPSGLVEMLAHTIRKDRWTLDKL